MSNYSVHFESFTILTVSKQTSFPPPPLICKLEVYGLSFDLSDWLWMLQFYV